MDLRIAITDDLNSEREKLSSAIIAPFSKVGLNVGNIDEYTSGEELLRQFSAGRYDLIFLDIYMGGMSGVETAKRIRTLDKNVMLVFVTTSNEFASESYAVKANFYLLKPVRAESIKQLAETVAQQLKNTGCAAALPDGTVIPLSSLVYTSCSGHYVNVFLVGNEPLKIRTTHKIMEESLSKYEGVISCNKGVLVMVTVIVSGATALLPVEPKVVFYILLVPLFLAYRVIVDADIVKCFATFLLSFTIMSFCKNYAIMIDAVIHPELGTPTFSTDGALIQLGISCAVTAAIAYPVAKYGSHLINGLPYRRVWLISIVMSLMFIGFNFTVQPVHYQTLYLNRVFLVYILITTLMFVMLVLMYTVFYFIASALLKAGKDKEHISVLEMQKKQYDAQQKYLEDTSRIRHDFKHSIIAIKTLADDGDIEELKSYLDNYIDTFPSRSPVRYCGNYALNALLCHFEEQAQQHSITLRLRIDGDNKETALTDDELCCIVGNILENAVNASLMLPENNDRRISLSVKADDASGNLYIVAENNFNGKVRCEGGHYYSTTKGGNGIGLESVLFTAEKHGGTATFYHKDKVFCSDVVIPLK